MAQVVSGTVVQTIATSTWTPPSPDPSGITYRPATGDFVTCDSEVDEILPPNPGAYQGVNVWFHSNTGVVAQTKNTLAFSNEPSGISWDPAGGRVWFSDDNANVIHQIELGADGLYGTADDRISDLDGIATGGCSDPEDVTYDNVHDVLYVANGGNANLCKIEPGLDGEFDGAPPTGDDVVSVINVTPAGSILNPDGIVYDPFENTLVVADRDGTRDLYELELDGTLVRRIDVTYPAPTPRPSGVTIAPATPNPAIRAYYVTDSRVDNDVNPAENDGRIFEVIAPPRDGNAAPVVDAGAPQTITLPNNSVTLAGQVSDDGHPYPPSAVTTTWSQLSGSGTVTFADASDPETTATFSTTGSYVLELEADDTAASASDTVTITVRRSGGAACGIGPELVAVMLGLGWALRKRAR